jgi:Cof subfamily protein (haloacid dehalogenase superfamily)
MTHIPETPRYKLLAVDLDGTLVGRGLEVPPGTVEAIQAFKTNGGLVTIATGRSVRTTIPFADQIGVNAPLICYQGAVVRDIANGVTLFHQPVPAALAAEAVKQLRDQNIYVHAYIDDELYVPYEGAETEFYQTFSTILLPIHVVDDLAGFVATHPPTKLLFIADEGDVEPHLAGLEEHFMDRLSVARSHARFGELTAPGSTKGQALAALAAHLGIEREHVAAAGDQGNDIDMVAWAGLGMGVRTGTAALRAVADVEIGPPEEGGLAKAIQTYLL